MNISKMKNISLYFAFLLYFILSTQLEPGHLVSIMLVLLNLVCFIAVLPFFKDKGLFLSGYVLLFFFIFIPFAFIFSDNGGLGNFILAYSTAMATFSFACYFLNKAELLKRLSLVLLLLYLFYLFVSFSLSFSHDIAFFEYANQMFINQSRNAVNFILIFCALLYLLSFRLTGSRPSLIIMFIVFIFGLLLYGRSGVIVCTALLLITIAFYYRNKLSIFIMIALFGIVIFNLDNIVTTLMTSTNLNQGIKSPRSLMLSEFINATDLKTLLLGVDIVKMPTVNYHHGNPHNSFLLLNIKYGGAFVIYILMTVLAGAMLFKKDLFVFLLFALFIFRISLDSVAFNGRITDLLFYLFICYAFLSSPRYNENFPDKKENN